MKLYMVRHGQSETNMRHQFTGWAQVPLTPQGEDDARRVGLLLRDNKFDRVYSSDLIRAVQTARIALPGCEPVQLPQLREIGLGSLELREFDQCAQEYGPAFVEHRRALDYTAYGGENYAMLHERVSQFLTMLENDHCELAVAFAHAGVLSCALDIVLGHHADRAHLRCPNGSVALFGYENGKWLLYGWGMGV